MDLKRMIITELVKEPQSKGANLGKPNPQDITVPINQRLIAELDSKYKTLEVRDTRFKTPFSQFKVALDGYSKVSNDRTFEVFTESVMKVLENIISKVWFAKGGYIVIADYDGFVGVFLIRHIKGLLIEKITGTIRMANPTEIIDYGKMAMACRIDIEKFTKNEYPYLSFVNDGNEPIAQYFLNWFSVDVGDIPPTPERIRAKADEIDIRFPMNLFRTKINFDPGKPNLIIIDSDSLASKLREKLGLNKTRITKAMKAEGKIELQKN